VSGTCVNFSPPYLLFSTHSVPSPGTPPPNPSSFLHVRLHHFPCSILLPTTRESNTLPPPQCASRDSRCHAKNPRSMADQHNITRLLLILPIPAMRCDRHRQHRTGACLRPISGDGQGPRLVLVAGWEDQGCWDPLRSSAAPPSTSTTRRSTSHCCSSVPPLVRCRPCKG
jgi:hypothetical protein